LSSRWEDGNFPLCVCMCVCVCVRVCKKLSSHWEDVDIHLMRRLVTISLYYINLT
jgi:hypothetical protein